tara:strand:+ start:48 stop:662 length:615 start_codon:yes stop_codon:yes gene_type:complete
MYNGTEISVVCQEMEAGKYAVPHVLMLEQKYRCAFNLENVAKDYDDSVKIEMIGFSRIWSVFWAHCHIAILQRILNEPEPEPEPEVEDKRSSYMDLLAIAAEKAAVEEDGFVIKTPLHKYLLGIPVDELVRDTNENSPKPETEPAQKPSSFEKEWEEIKPTDSEEANASMCSTIKSICVGYSPADDSDDDELGAPLTRTMSRRE